MLSTYLNRCFHLCLHHPQRTNPRSIFESVVLNVCVKLSIEHFSLLHLSRRSTKERTKMMKFVHNVHYQLTSIAASKSVQLTRPSLFVSRVFVKNCSSFFIDDCLILSRGILFLIFCLNQLVEDVREMRGMKEI